MVASMLFLDTSIWKIMS